MPGPSASPHPSRRPDLRHPVPPERLPAVQPAELLAAWSLARRAAALQLWGPPRLLRFDRPSGDATEIAIADADAGCWAEAIDTAIGLGNLPGLALCLRLLALVEVLARVPALARCSMSPRTARPVPVPSMPRPTAARCGARFDEAAIRRRLSNRLPPGAAERRRTAPEGTHERLRPAAPARDPTRRWACCQGGSRRAGVGGLAAVPAAAATL